MCRNLVEAVRQRQHREEGLAALRQELARRPAGPRPHQAGRREFGLPPALQPLSEPGSRGPAGHRRCSRAPCCPDGRQVCAADQRRHTLSPEDVGLGYKAMMIIEARFRRMKTTGLRIRPVYHWTAHRITSHIRLCVLALLLERAAEIRVENYLAQPAVCSPRRSRPCATGSMGSRWCKLRA